MLRGDQEVVPWATWPWVLQNSRVSQEEMWPSLRDKDWAFRFTFPSTKGLFWVVFLWVSALERWQAIIVTGSGRSYSQCPAWLCSISSQRNCSCLGPGKKAQTTSQRDHSVQGQPTMGLLFKYHEYPGHLLLIS